MAKRQSKSARKDDTVICELCAGTGSVLQMHSARRGHPDLNALHCPVCGGTGRVKKPKPK